MWRICCLLRRRLWLRSTGVGGVRCGSGWIAALMCQRVHRRRREKLQVVYPRRWTHQGLRARPPPRHVDRLLDGSGRAKAGGAFRLRECVSKRIDMHNLRYIEIFLADIDPNRKAPVAACVTARMRSRHSRQQSSSSPQSQVAALTWMRSLASMGGWAPPFNGPKLSIADWWRSTSERTRQFGKIEFPHTAQLNLTGTANVNESTL